MRADLFPDDEVAIAPRARLSWAFDPRALLSVAAGRYHQPTRTPDVEVERTLQEVVSAELSPPQLLPVARADHIVVSLEQLFAGRVRLGVHGYWKSYMGSAAASGGAETTRSSGLDLRLGSAGESEVVWLGYGLSWFWTASDLSGYSRDFAGRHLLTAGVSGALWGPVRGGFRMAYGAGLPHTAIPFRSLGFFGDDVQGVEPAPPPESGPDPPEPPGTDAFDSPLLEGLDDDFLRIDFELHARLTSRWGGTTGRSARTCAC